MKNIAQLQEATKDEDLPNIYCDLDEVLVDFMRSANAAVGGEFARMDTKERWAIINNTKR